MSHPLNKFLIFLKYNETFSSGKENKPDDHS